MSAETRPPDISDSYASRAKQVGPDLEDRNVLIVRVRKSAAASNRLFDDSVCEIMCKIIGVKPIIDTVGCQYLMDRGDIVVEIWLKENIQASKFSSDLWREICPGFDIVSVHPALAKEVTLLILDLPLNTKDKVVRDYVAKFGGKLAPQPPQFVKAKSGIWVGQPNGDRKYKADFSGQIIPMGTYHFLGGRRVRVIYNGNTRTCGRCHQPPTNCPGDGIASKCREKSGPQVFIHEHMKKLDLLINQARDNANRVLPPLKTYETWCHSPSNHSPPRPLQRVMVRLSTNRSLPRPVQTCLSSPDYHCRTSNHSPPRILQGVTACLSANHSPPHPVQIGTPSSLANHSWPYLN